MRIYALEFVNLQTYKINTDYKVCIYKSRNANNRMTKIDRLYDKKLPQIDSR